MSTQAKAMRIRRYGGPEVLEWVDIDVPPPAPGEVTLRQTAVGLNYRHLFSYRPVPAAAAAWPGL
ncbi:NADPH:quinone reductase-like Zn-dependent oxidoreductase [Kerstersia gyiorum]|nr:NADPH:quinone reductase-like Zn-dependent oxidoreductase [Kerstersia gyiorum]MCP1672283.1 NADPH:quinone reductase-like Zn-dependent oxidoreductase [Kerstersia gyiorum]MCP1710281.1 NADPH:quinone reductase-like Zn-dependent oxidoreductase [Kerstersia gyiorum]